MQDMNESLQESGQITIGEIAQQYGRSHPIYRQILPGMSEY